MKKVIDTIALIILLIGGINWGLIGVLDYNIIEKLAGIRTLPTLFIYTLVGIASLYYIVAYFVGKQQTQ